MVSVGDKSAVYFMLGRPQPVDALAEQGWDESRSINCWDHSAGKPLLDHAGAGAGRQGASEKDGYNSIPGLRQADAIMRVV